MEDKLRQTDGILKLAGRTSYSGFAGITLTSEVLDGADDLSQEVIVLRLDGWVSPSLDVLEHERAERCVRNQRQAQREVRKELPEARCAFDGLGLNACSFLQCHWHLLHPPLSLQCVCECGHVRVKSDCAAVALLRQLRHWTHHFYPRAAVGRGFHGDLYSLSTPPQDCPLSWGRSPPTFTPQSSDRDWPVSSCHVLHLIH